MLGTGGFINPKKILENIGLAAGMFVADFGCGHGYFALPAAKIAGEQGKIFAVDVLAEALEAVKSQAQLQGALNIEVMRGDLEVTGGSKIGTEAVDMVLLHNVLFQSQKKMEILREAKRVLKAGGRLELIEWRPEKNTFGPKEGWRLAVPEAKKLAGDEGFNFEREFDAGEYHFGLIFVKP